MTRRRRQVLAWVLSALVLFPAVLVVLLRWFEHANVYQPSRNVDAAAGDLGRPSEEIWLNTPDGERLRAWFFPAPEAGPRRDWVLLHCHGNAGNISHRLATYEALLETGAAVLGFDYRGYGQSSGRPSEAGTYTDARSAYEWLRRRGFAADRIVAHGESLGGGVASGLADRVPTAGLILQSTFTSIPDLGAEIFPWLPVRTLGRIRYDTLARLRQIKVPVLVLHGRGDTIVPFRHGERLFAAAREPKLFRELTGDHNDAMDFGRPGCLDALNAFLELLERRAVPQRTNELSPPLTFQLQPG